METITITSGIFKGRRLKTPGKGTHPMGSREKIALFNMLTPYLKNAYVLDAFAGSGALGLEAISRGAKSITFLETSKKASAIIKENMISLGFNANTPINASTDFAPDVAFDIIIADPPYDAFDLKTIIPLVDFLDTDGILALSHPGDAPTIPGLDLLKTKKYARCHLSIYQKA
ncbi:RsmD family RNA methyltransferase [Candidatus Saccharibacteria bacterium]|nr:RsmD family RNA methyltransferase [Candidatus Saccharibacteria bacterium]